MSEKEIFERIPKPKLKIVGGPSTDRMQILLGDQLITGCVRFELIADADEQAVRALITVIPDQLNLDINVDDICIAEKGCPINLEEAFSKKAIDEVTNEIINEKYKKTPKIKLPSCVCTPELPVFGKQVDYKEKGLYELLVTSACKEQAVLEKHVPTHENSVNQAKIDAFRKPGEVYVKEPLKQSDLNTVHLNRVQSKARYRSWKSV